jgi:hypothetical protein
MHEYSVNLHIHTNYSDGTQDHAFVAREAIKAGIDALIFTDHNIYLNGLDQYYHHDGKKVLVIIAEEIHDQAANPQKNHLLVFGAKEELAHYAHDTQSLINNINSRGGISFLAHPVDPESKAFGEGDLSWENWDVSGYTGIELWNAMSEFKSLLSSFLMGLYYAFNFKKVAHGPLKETIKIWDGLLSPTNKVVAIAGSDSHQLEIKKGPINRLLFPYHQHFQAVNTHVLTEHKFTGDAIKDQELILLAMKQGHCFAAYDLPMPTKGFRFNANTIKGKSIMGDSVTLKSQPSLQVYLPSAAECRLIKDGVTILTEENRYGLVYKVKETGVYRVEVYVEYEGKKRAWIFSNPIYVN